MEDSVILVDEIDSKTAFKFKGVKDDLKKNPELNSEFFMLCKLIHEAGRSVVIKIILFFCVSVRLSLLYKISQNKTNFKWK